MWVAGKPLKVKVADDRYEDRKIDDPVPEAVKWPHRVFESHKNLGWIRWAENKPAKSVKTAKKRGRRKVSNVDIKG
jgi:hypothetical protein